MKENMFEEASCQTAIEPISGCLGVCVRECLDVGGGVATLQVGEKESWKRDNFWFVKV